jgi:ankyrin repeat protein
MLEALRYCLPSSVQGILEELPETLDETYKRVLKDIHKANREHARRLLQCLAVALRPLRVEELAEVLTIDFDAPAHGGIPQLNANWRLADHHQAVLSTCSSLIAIVDDGDHQVVQFSHYSVKEFLTSDRLARSGGDVSHYHITLDSELAHTILAKACLGVLLRLDNIIRSSEIPLFRYATRHWFDHARFKNVASSIQDVMIYFFDAEKPHWPAWSQVNSMDVEWEWFTPKGEAGDASPLYYASLGGFYDLAEHLVGKNPEQINAGGGQLVSPLVAALYRKHFQVAELLHRNGADVNVRGLDRSPPLQTACVDGRIDIVRWLVDHGADVNAQGYQDYGPLHEAADYGHVEAVEILLEHKADVHIRTMFGAPPLHVAARPHAYRNQVEIMQTLLDHDANPNARDNDDSTPLHYSSWCQKEYTEPGYKYKPQMGTVEGTLLLLKHGAIIDAKDNKGRTALQLALEHKRKDIATCLKDHGAIMDVEVDEGGAALQPALEQGRDDVATSQKEDGATQ